MAKRSKVTRHLGAAGRSFVGLVSGKGAEFIPRRRRFIRARAEIERAVIAESATNPDVMRSNACPACGSADTSERLESPVGFRFAVCAHDGALYMDPVLTDAALARLYNDPAYELRWTEAERRERVQPEDENQKDLHALVEMLGPSFRGARLLDVGCAAGAFLAAASDYFEVQGVELSENNAAAAREKGLDVRTGYVSDCEGEGLFDVVTMIQLIEHLPNPAETLAHVRRLLRPGGMLYVSTPSTDAPSFRLLGSRHRHMGGFAHVSLFNRASLVRAVERSGFECVEHEQWGRSDLALHDVVSLRLARDRYFQGMALFSPRLYHACALVDAATLGLASRLALPAENRPFQRALFRKVAE